jgi:hypothetical protein
MEFKEKVVLQIGTITLFLAPMIKKCKEIVNFQTCYFDFFIINGFEFGIGLLLKFMKIRIAFTNILKIAKFSLISHLE